jgi:hypothetical protein
MVRIHAGQPNCQAIWMMGMDENLGSTTGAQRREMDRPQVEGAALSAANQSMPVSRIARQSG